MDSILNAIKGIETCALIPFICKELITAITSSNSTYDNADLYDILAGHGTNNFYFIFLKIQKYVIYNCNLNFKGPSGTSL